MYTYSDVKGLDFQTVLDEINFKVDRESLVASDSLTASKKDMVLRDGAPLGIVSQKRPMIPYSDMMKWVTDELSKTNIDFKIKDSVITEKGDLYQEYIFDMDVPSPDGNEMASMIILKGSYVGIPMHLQFGTYRFVCRNGVVVGETVGDIKVKAREGKDILQSSIIDNIHEKFDMLTKVSDKYKTLNDGLMSEYLINFLSTKYIPMMMKKTVMYTLQTSKDIELTVEKIKRENIMEPEELYRLVKEQTAFYLYNVMTAYASHEVNSINSRVRHFNAISKFFNI